MSDPTLEELRAIRRQLGVEVAGTQRFLELVEDYNALLRLVMIGMRSPLEPNDEIADALILEDYRELRRLYRERGPYTIHNLIDDRDLIALVDVRRIGWRGENVSVVPRQVYKGDPAHLKQKVQVPKSRMPDPWFRKDEVAVLFACCDAGTAVALGPLGRMPLSERMDGTWVLGWDCGPEFWPGFPVSPAEAGTLALWEPVRELLLSQRTVRPSRK